MAKLAVISLGCPKNTVISNQLKASLLKNKHQLVKKDEADFLIVNTCGFIREAQEQSIETLLSLIKEKKKSRQIIATGCLVDLHQKDLSKALPEIKSFIKTTEIPQLSKLLGKGSFSLKEQLVKNSSYAYLKIAEGCDLSCSFCIIPKIKGNFKSRQREDIVAEAQSLWQQGVRELVVVSQDTGRYGLDIYGQLRLSELLTDLSQLNFNRIRVMYLQPHYLDAKLIKTLTTTKNVCAYLDMPIQHASASILKAMRRIGDKAKYANIVKALRQASKEKFYWRTTVMTGFPGETKSDFYELISFIKKTQPDYLGVFAFSPEAGTAAAAFKPKVKKETVQRRVQTLRQLANEISFKSLESWLEQEVEVLIDKVTPEEVIGRTYFQAPEIDGEVIIVNKKEPLTVGQTVKVKLKSLVGYDFYGVIKDVQSC